MLKDKIFETGIEGNRLLILGAVHGNEPAGTFACERLIENIERGKVKLVKGSLSLVPIVNGEAYEKDIRQVEENLNRVINKWDNPSSYEQLLGIETAKKIDECDYLLDIHSTHNPKDVPFAFLDYKTAGNMQIIRAMEVGYVLIGWPEVYNSQEAISDYSTERYANLAGKNGITLEAGYHKDKKAVDLAYNSIINLLKELKIIEGEFLPAEKTMIKMTDIIIKEKEGRFVKDFKHLDFVAENTLIAVYEDGKELRAGRDNYIIIPNHEAKIGAEWYYLGLKN